MTEYLPYGPYAGTFVGLTAISSPPIWPYGPDPLWDNVVYMTMFDQLDTGVTSFTDETGNFTTTLGATQSIDASGRLVNPDASALALATDNVLLDHGGGAFCMEGFYYIEDFANPTPQPDFARYWIRGNSSDWGWGWDYIFSGGHNSRIRGSSNGTTLTTQLVGNEITSGSWVHLAQVYTGSKHIVYVDGVQAAFRTINPQTNGAGGLFTTVRGLWRGFRFTIGNSRYGDTPVFSPIDAANGGFGRANGLGAV